MGYSLLYLSNDSSNFNIIVVSSNSLNYIRAGNYNLKLLIPLIGSIPFAFIGGTLLIEKETF